LCSVVSGILAAFLSGAFEAQLQAAVALALFIPVVLALSESVAIQSATLALRQMQSIRPSWTMLLRRMVQEVPTGILLGAVCATLVGLVALVWKQQQAAALCIAGGIAGGITMSAVVGLTWPYVLRILKVDPQVAAGPIALASADMLTLLLYFNLAVWLL
jgi:magnesium transporter